MHETVRGDTVRATEPFLLRVAEGAIVRLPEQSAIQLEGLIEPLFHPETESVLSCFSENSIDRVALAVSIFDGTIKTIIGNEVTGECADSFPLCGEQAELRHGLIHCKRYGKTEPCWKYQA